MSSLKEVKNRINSVKSTQKITSAMQMVASAKLHKRQQSIEVLYPYQQQMDDILNNFLSSDMGDIRSPYIEERKVKRVAILPVSSNSSLCGAFNANVNREFLEVYTQYKEELGEDNLEVYPIGRKVADYVRKLNITVKQSFDHLSDKPTFETAHKLVSLLMNKFIEKEIDKVVIIYHHFKMISTQVLMVETFLPLKLSALIKERKNQDTLDKDNLATPQYIVEPSVQEFIEELIPQAVRLKMFTILLDANTSEHAARMLAMQLATDNADELIEDLTQQYNKTRQQSITNELLDIIGGTFK
ncbi:MAG: F0F1 ATP synthase subunit gamma [Bacteroidales bacterium]|nr:F0F1 ATP synthase subunit gamma [Bacteroidales bacterium]